ncbi:MAG TPA: LysM peptidoglycan-binding domain-containing protein, partial [Anaerolineae bacterium]|nr:LysM peptidoglycan-binding domain-containing protein [Anaerolineae bacterium]
MKWRHWAILIVLVLLNYIVFSTAFTRMAERRRPLHATHTPMPTFTVVVAGPVSWVVLPTSTPFLTRAPSTATAVPAASTEAPTATEAMVTAEVTGTQTIEAPTAVESTATAAATATSTPSPAPPATDTPTAQVVVHTVKQGEYLALIARQYGITVQAIITANNLADPNHIVPGQKLVIPVNGEAPVATATQMPANTAPPAASATYAPATATRPPATATPRPPTATPKPPTATPKPAPAGFQFTGAVVWDPGVAPNCSGPAISRHSRVQDTAGNPVNGVRIQVDCYG